MQKEKVLVVEDHLPLHQLWGIILGKTFELTFAVSIEEAEKILFTEDRLMTFSLIVMDCCVLSSTPNTMPLVKKIRAAGYVGPILANSGTGDTDKLLEVGASHEVDKFRVTSKVKEILRG